jgi:chorismate mutase
MQTYCRGIRGATTVASNTKEAILEASSELLQKMIKENGVVKEQIACVFFTTTIDLNAAFPAQAARRLGWKDVALLCGHEMNVPESKAKCLRVLMLVNTDKKPKDIVHIYINGTEDLRSDDEP